MKKLVLTVLATALFTGIGIQNASADNSLKQGTAGLNVLVNQTPYISGKYLISKDLAVLAGLGLGIHGGDDKRGADIIIGAGVRKYLKVADFAPFVGGTIGFLTSNDSNDSKTFLQGEAGAEVFLHKQLSFEGTIALRYTGTSSKTSADPTVPTTTSKTSLIDTPTLGVSLNYYF